MRFSSQFKRAALAAAISATLSAPVLAQDTASAMRGSVVGPQGNPATSTDIIIEHMPSGSTVRVSTDENGNFIANGLRVGGPYRVVLDSDTYRDAVYSDIFIKLGDTYRLQAQLEGETMERLEVTGQAINMASLNTGSSSSFGEENIESMPAFNRDLKSILRQNPLAVSLSDEDSSLTVAGSNPRYNSITVDGIGQNDDFGLNGNGYPTQRSPISLSAIQELSIDVVPFSAKNGGFSGAKINAVTKSGTNEFEGELFYEYASDSLAGDPEANRYDEDATAPELDFTEKTWGGALGGPIIKDKLFFFASYETYEEPKGIARGPVGAAANQVASVTEAEIDEVSEVARNVYGVEPGVWDARPEEEDEKFLLKLDWNISNEHRASLTYQTAESNNTNNNTGGRDAITLSSGWYDKSEDMSAYALQVFSNWNANLATDVKISYKDVETAQAPLLGLGFGDVTVQTSDGFVELGPDRYRHANELNNTTTEIQFNGEYLTGDHAIGFGFEWEEIDVFNLFVNDSRGIWEFDSIEDFRNRTASDFRYRNAYTNVSSDGAASFTNGGTAIYIEDTWTPTWNLEVTAGLRYERQSADDTPTYNENFEARYGFPNTENLDGESILLPRAGFKWDLNDNYRLRGGFGRYAGGRPNVWIANAYSNDGVTIVNSDLRQLDPSVYLENVDITSVPEAVQNTLQAGDGNTTPIDPNFELPNEWRYSLALDYSGDLGMLGKDWFASVEFIRTRKQSDVQWVDLGRTPLLDEDGNVVTTPDGGRIIYAVDDPLDNFTPSAPGDFNGVNRYDIMLTNGYGGESNIFTGSIGKAWNNGLSFNASYTNQDIEEAVNGGSSRAESNYQYVTVLDRQNPQPATAGYEIEHRFVLTAQYKTEFFDGYQSKFNLFYERVSGRPYSWALSSFRDQWLGDQTSFDDSDQYLAYIPSGPNDPAVRYEGGMTYESFMELAEAAGVDGYAGGYTPRNGSRGPWNTNIDFRYEQEIPGLLNDHRGSFYIDVKNVLALIDEESAQKHIIPFADTTQTMVDWAIDPETTQYVYSPVFGGFDDFAPTSYRASESTWQIKLGVSYKF
ncbi:TonB-dependent receptor [Idiomarina seosinensis]|uniref:TonB-dependent receptor n=1 Tax=Idiomarina seosinensis TaxID=281739 RepID=UPI0038516707